MIKKALACVTIACLVGCSTFKHQTSRSEPHAILIVMPDSEMINGRIVKVDERRIPIKKSPLTYRVSVGEHVVSVEDVVTTTHAVEDDPVGGVLSFAAGLASFAGVSEAQSLASSPNGSYTEKSYIITPAHFNAKENQVFILDGVVVIKKD